ncbi:NUDIX domain-containing protein [Virgibacillus kekensis]|uniref:NUDIX domain-containing protein n=1 Tax=Virgibacillus kekensis TaxID=202261 RepID=A0ABV9DJT3_9BACI
MNQPIYRRKTYKIKPEMLATFNDFFHTYLYPNQMAHGAKLVGRWVNEARDEITAIWEYNSMDHYKSIEEKIRATDLHHKAFLKRQELGRLYEESSQEFLTSTSSPDTYHHPQHIVSVCGYITNEKGEVLLVRNEHRADTMEMPGGQVEEGETLAQAVHREVLEETGAEISLTGVTGIYQNIRRGIICVVFRGKYQSGELRPAVGETSEVIFAELTKETINSYITKNNFRNRALDAMNPSYIPYEAFDVRPYELVSRFEVKQEVN